MKTHVSATLILLFFANTLSWSQFLGNYPLTVDYQDKTGLNSPIVATNAPFVTGTWCNGTTQGEGAYDITTPVIKGLSYDGLILNIDFFPISALAQPVLMGGLDCAWLGLSLNADTTVSLIINSVTYKSTIKYRLNDWNKARIQYSGTTATLTINSTTAASRTVSLQLKDSCPLDFRVTIKRGNKGFRGIVRNLRITDFANRPLTLAYYPLERSYADSSKKNTDILATNAPFVSGIWCNGMSYGSEYYKVKTPVINEFNKDNFSISFDFLPTVAEKRPVIVCGASCGWAVFNLNPDSIMAIFLNKVEKTAGSSTKHYLVNQWNNAVINYDGTTLKVILNQSEVFSKVVALSGTICPDAFDFTTTSNSSGNSFEGFYKNLHFGTLPILTSFYEDVLKEVSFYLSSSREELHFLHAGNEAKELNVFNMQGQLVLHSFATTSSINVAGLKEGVYTVRMIEAGKILTGKFLK